MLFSPLDWRASRPVADRSDFFVYIDEFQNMTTNSLPDVLSEARKYRMGLTLANHVDVTGDAELTAQNALWAKYATQPLLKIWTFKKTP